MTNVRLWSRDFRILGETNRWVYLRSQLGRLLRSPQKKMAERLCLLHRHKYVERMSFFQDGMQGRAEYVYFGLDGRRPSQSQLPHRIMVAEVRVQSALSLPPGQGYSAEFLYGHEVSMTTLRPDGVLIVSRAGSEHSALVLFEADTGTERLVSPKAYDLLGKLRSYAALYDSGQIIRDFSWAGVFRGVRVCVVLTSAIRLRNLQRLLASEDLDFVLLTTTEQLTQGLYSPIWTTPDGETVDVFGRRVRHD